MLLSDVPQGSILGPIIFTIYANSKDIETPLLILEKESEMAISRLNRENEMIINYTEFQAMITNRGNKSDVLYDLHVNNQIITSTDSIILLWVSIYVVLNFDRHISRICNKVESKINAISKIQKKNLGKRRKRPLLLTLLWFQTLTTDMIPGVNMINGKASANGAEGGLGIVWTKL